eukprot:3937093-Rhodomonas_salina.1
MEMQRKWTALLRCKCFMLKFRPPYPSRELPRLMRYLCGCVVLQVYAPRNSTECCLMGDDWHSVCTYDIEKHEEQMAYFNNVVREDAGELYDARAAVHIMSCYEQSWHNERHRTPLLDLLHAAKSVFPEQRMAAEWRNWSAVLAAVQFA